MTLLTTTAMDLLHSETTLACNTPDCRLYQGCPT